MRSGKTKSVSEDGRDEAGRRKGESDGLVWRASCTTSTTSSTLLETGEKEVS